MRRRVTRRLTRLQTMYNFLKYHKTWWYNDKISIYNFLKYRKTWWYNDKISIYRTGAQPHQNRKLIQFDYGQYCNPFKLAPVHTLQIEGASLWRRRKNFGKNEQKMYTYRSLFVGNFHISESSIKSVQQYLNVVLRAFCISVVLFIATVLNISKLNNLPQPIRSRTVTVL